MTVLVRVRINAATSVMDCAIRTSFLRAVLQGVCSPMIGMRWVVDPYATVPYHKYGDIGLMREVDASPRATRTLSLGVVRKGQAEIGSKIHHLFVTDGTSRSAVCVPIGSMGFNREIEQALPGMSGFGVCSCCATMDESGESVGLFEDFSHGDEQRV